MASVEHQQRAIRIKREIKNRENGNCGRINTLIVECRRAAASETVAHLQIAREPREKRTTARKRNLWKLKLNWIKFPCCRAFSRVSAVVVSCCEVKEEENMGRKCETCWRKRLTNLSHVHTMFVGRVEIASLTPCETSAVEFLVINANDDDEWFCFNWKIFKRLEFNFRWISSLFLFGLKWN